MNVAKRILYLEYNRSIHDFFNHQFKLTKKAEFTPGPGPYLHKPKNWVLCFFLIATCEHSFLLQPFPY